MLRDKLVLRAIRLANRMENIMKNALKTLRRALALAHPWMEREEGMATAEYAIGTLAAAAFAGLLLAIIRSGSLSGMLESILSSALSVN